MLFIKEGNGKMLHTYWQDTPIKPGSSQPQNPDIYNLNQSANQTVRLSLHVVNP